MSRSTHLSRALFTAAAFVAIAGCSSEPSPSGATTAQSATMTAPAVSTPAPAMSSAPAPTMTAAPAAPRSDCPKDSAGPGTLTDPCLAKGKDRLMEVTWTGKMDDSKGPSFKVVNKSDKTILYGRAVLYFYDKAGKQMEVKGSDGKMYPSLGCAGNLFAGVMKPGEKATMWFSCVGKSDVPEGAKNIEVEMQTVGFADASEKKSEFYWRNNNLVPDVRAKGGVK